MTVKELIKKLSKCDPKAEVIIKTYEEYWISEVTSGYDEVEKSIDSIYDLDSRVEITLAR